MFGTILALKQPISLGANYTLNANAQRIAGSFFAEKTGIQGFYIKVENVLGAPLIHFSLQESTEDGNYVPTGIELAYTEVSAFTANNLNYITLSYSSLTLYKRYFIVASYISGSTSISLNFPFFADGVVKKTSVDSGSTWASLIGGSTLIMPKFSDGYLSDYYPVVSGAGTSSIKIYGSTEFGVSLLPSLNSELSIRGFSATFYKSGSPIFTIIGKIYINGSLVATSANCFGSATIGGSTNQFVFIFDRIINAPRCANVKLVLAVQGATGGSTSNYIICSNNYPLSGTLSGGPIPELDALAPFNSSWRNCYSTDSGTTWTQEEKMVCWSIFLDHFGGYPPINRRTSIGR